MTNNFTSSRLRASILWFGTMAALLSWPVALLVSRWLEVSSWAGLTMAAVLATTFSSILVWWLFIVRPEHVSILRGVEAGIVSVIAASFLMCWLFEAYSMAYGVVVQRQDIGAFLVAMVLVMSILFWRFFTVLPEPVRILRGVLAGIASIIVAPFLLWCFYDVYSVAYGVVIQHQPIIGALLNMIGALLITLAWPIFIMLFVCITPLGWLFFPIGGIAGGLLACYLRRIIASF